MGVAGASNAAQRFVLDDGESSNHSGRKTTLLDLGDELLLDILNRLHDAPAVASFGAVNKRLYRLHFSVRGICATIKTGSLRSHENAPKRQYTEDHLRTLLRALAVKGSGVLQQLSVSIDQDKETRGTRRLQPSKLDWIKLVSSSIQSLELNFFLSPDHVPQTLFADLASCTNLVTLKLTCGRRVMISGEMLAQVMASCKKLKTFSIVEAFSCPWDSVELVSESLEELSLLLPTGDMSYLHEIPSFVLETPALKTLLTSLNVNKFDLRSHALRSLSMESLKELTLGLSPLANLEKISAGENWSFAAVEQVLRSSTSCFLEALSISDKAVPLAKLATIIPRHLREVKYLQVTLQGRAPGLDAPVVEASWLKVEELLVMTMKNHDEEREQHEHLYNSVVLLQRSFPLVERIELANCLFMDVEGAWRWSKKVHQATKRAEEDLKREFPDKISLGSNLASILGSLL